MSDIDPADVAAHALRRHARRTIAGEEHLCDWCTGPVEWPCEPYRLAAEVATLRGQVQRGGRTREARQRAALAVCQQLNAGYDHRRYSHRFADAVLSAALDDPTEPEVFCDQCEPAPSGLLHRPGECDWSATTPAEPELQPEPREAGVVDLVAALRASVEAAKMRREKAERERKSRCWMCGAVSSEMHARACSVDGPMP